MTAVRWYLDVNRRVWDALAHTDTGRTILWLAYLVGWLVWVLR